MITTTAVIRFKNSERTLPAVLAALAQQSRPVQRILAIDTGSTDSSRDILKQYNADIITWDQPYHHAKVLNFGLAQVDTERVLVLSSHTIIDSDSGLETLHAAVDDEGVCAASLCWEGCPETTTPHSWDSVSSSGLKFGSIYSNSLGLFEYAWWKRFPFNEQLNGVEDYYWALQCLQAGAAVHQRAIPTQYCRQGHNRLIAGTARIRWISKNTGIPIRWLGTRCALQKLAIHALPSLWSASSRAEWGTVGRRLLGFHAWPLYWRS